jgi:hypothetical protein
MMDRFVENERWFRGTEAQVKYSDDGKKMVLRDVVLDELNVPTSNGTMYRVSHMAPGLKKLGDLIARGQGYIFVDHPEEKPDKDPVPNEANQFARAGLRVTELRWKPDAGDFGKTKVLADINVLDTSMGRDIRACLEDGGAIGFSKRGLVEKWVTENDKQYGTCKVPTKYFFEGYDCVVGQAVRAAETREYVLEQETKELQMELKDIKTAEDLKGLPKGVYDHILTVAGESVRQQVEADHAKKQTETVDQKIEAAIKPLKEQIAAITTERDKLQAGLSKVVESLVAADLVEDREPADAEKELRGKRYKKK